MRFKVNDKLLINKQKLETDKVYRTILQKNNTLNCEYVILCLFKDSAICSDYLKGCLLKLSDQYLISLDEIPIEQEFEEVDYVFTIDGKIENEN